MQILTQILIIVSSIIALWYGAVLVVDSASLIAKKLGLSELVIGLTVVAIATSLPEFAVTITSALRGQYQISVGNIVGSDIFNLGIILGLVTFFSSVKISKKMLFRDGSMLIATGALLLFFFYDLKLQFYEGIVLFVILIAYIIYLIKGKEDADDFIEEVPGGKYQWTDIPKLVIGIALIIAGGNYLVHGSIIIARYYGVSEWMIGITIVGAGTSIPELATSIVAVTKGRHGISAGNLIGSDLFNMLGVLGVAGIIHPLTITKSDYLSLLFMAANLFILFYLMRRKWSLSKPEGAILISLAIVRWAIVMC